MAEVSVTFSRSDLQLLKEIIEMTPTFEGRSELWDAINHQLHQFGSPEPLHIQERYLSNLSHRILLVDPDTIRLRGIIYRALRTAAQPA